MTSCRERRRTRSRSPPTARPLTLRPIAATSVCWFATSRGVRSRSNAAAFGCPISSAPMKRLTLLLLLISAAAGAQDFMPVDFDQATGKLMLHINHIGDEFIYVASLPAGVGSNPIGLDRGEMGET